MLLELKYKKTITFLIIGLLLIAGLLLYKEQATNKEAPKRANFVFNNLKDVI